jgi:hypothetical protein
METGYESDITNAITKLKTAVFKGLDIISYGLQVDKLDEVSARASSSANSAGNHEV